MVTHSTFSYSQLQPSVVDNELQILTCMREYRYYCLSILDKHHHPDITLGQGIKILTMCTDELKRRMPIDFKGMTVKAVTRDGIVDIEFDDDKVVKSA